MLTAVVVGCGAMSAKWLLAAQKVQDLKVVGLVDIDEARARARAAEFGLTEAAIGANLKAILAAIRPDMLFNVVVPQARRDVAVTALAAGCHVLSEKPLAASMEDARVILEAARDHNRLHAVVQNRRYLANVRRLRRFLQAGELGRLTSIHADFFLAPHFGGIPRGYGPRPSIGHGHPHLRRGAVSGWPAAEVRLLRRMGAGELMVQGRLFGRSLLRIRGRRRLQLSRQLVRSRRQDQLGERLAADLRARRRCVGRI